MKPVVSCLVTTYNYGHLIARALDSALAQDYGTDALEIIVIDDGSTDDTAQVVAPYLDRIKYVRKDNGGLVSSINRGIDEATGQLIAFLDADDEWPPDKVSRQAAAFEGRPELGIVYSDLETVDEDGAVIEPSYFGMLELTPPRGRISGALLVRNYVTGGSMMFRAALKGCFHPLDTGLVCNDWPMAARMAAVAEVDVIDAPLYRYREHGANMNLGTDEDKRLRLSVRENEVRRRLLAEIEPWLATDAELLDGCQTLDLEHAKAQHGLGLPADQLMRVTPDDQAAARRCLAAGKAAARTGDRHVALCRFVNAIGHDPLNAEIRAQADAALRPDQGESAGDSPLADARDFAVLAFADELVRRPELLAAYTGAFGPGDNATLILYGAGWDESRATRELPALIAAAGVDAEGCADLLALMVPADAAVERLLAARVQAVLSEEAQDGMFAGLPLYTQTAIPALRLLAERSWAMPGMPLDAQV